MIKIKEAKQIREKFEFTHLVILGISEDGAQHVATHGKTVLQAKEAAAMGNRLKREMRWPEEFCNTDPLERKCENCSYWQRKKIDHSERIPENWSGKCMLYPETVLRYDKDRGCTHFEPFH